MRACLPPNTHNAAAATTTTAQLSTQAERAVTYTFLGQQGQEGQEGQEGQGQGQQGQQGGLPAHAEPDAWPW